ncbi:MAG: bifunctional proline dehydrogenase/L-glutamate gamma-semialdehyde dehydrogenase PutA, partial [Rhodobacteraceae bacterium]|nr:bifunctional proline dehydrogenase/L-glutamate gamma-semialdehyde dehydrogenase PutA [Paracoccaceae bacterium]
MTDFRARIDDATYIDEPTQISNLVQQANLSLADRDAICDRAASLVDRIRTERKPGLMEVFLAEYGLSTEEGIALMCLAEALLRVPDAETIDALIEDKIAPSDWSRHMGHSTSPLVNASTWALMLTGRVLQNDIPGPVGHLRTAIRRLGEPVIRTAVARAMKEMGAQFVLGETIEAAMQRGRTMEQQGYTYSYDMLGEAARTEADARRYHLAYSAAISAIAQAATQHSIAQNPGISVKLSALYPRYEEAQRADVMAHLVPRLQTLAELAASAGIGLNVDAEEASRLSLSLDVIEAALSGVSLGQWQGFGVVVQAYGPRASHVIDWLYDLARRLDRRIMVRLVKGAYWDSEIKLAQVAGLDAFPVFTNKAATDVSYIANARKLLGMTDRLYPQFATHNAHTVAAILHMGADPADYEFQRLHGMGEALHDIVKKEANTGCRIYAPVGAHHDLLAYLVRRLLENGANSSFVHQIVDTDVPADVVVADPFTRIGPTDLATGAQLFAPNRRNSMGFDLQHRPTLTHLAEAMAPYQAAQWMAQPLVVTQPALQDMADTIINPDFGLGCANTSVNAKVGQVTWATADTVQQAAADAVPWAAAASAVARTEVLNRAADLFEAQFGEFFALLTREAGKTLADAVAELREAVDFLRYYAGQTDGGAPVGVFACISPWNFPLAIFTGQIAAALAAGNAVLAKPAEQTPLIAMRAVELLHTAGVPRAALQMLPGAGPVGAALTKQPQVGGVAFTGSTQTAHSIHRAMAQHLPPGAPLIAETGGLNAMIVDSTALPEQAVQAIVESAFQSAGQRCSALRCLYLQEDCAQNVLTMLRGAMRCLKVGDPWLLSTDIGPVIDAKAQSVILSHIAAARAEGRVIEEGDTPKPGHFIAPTLIKITGIEDLTHEIFGPVLHVATYRAEDLDKVINAINATGYGLTFGLQTRIDDRVQHVADRVHAGNIYVNRNQIGAIVGSQPFGGEGLSGTGPKAGGPSYVARFRTTKPQIADAQPSGQISAAQLLARVIAAPQGHEDTEVSLPGPTGESNQLRTSTRAPILCLGPGQAAATRQAESITALGGRAVLVPEDTAPETLTELKGISGVIWWGNDDTARAYRKALAERPGPILPLVTGAPDRSHARTERHVCID